MQTLLYSRLAGPFSHPRFIFALIFAQHIRHMLLGEAVPTHVGDASIDVNYFGCCDLGLQAGLDLRLKILRNCSSPQRWRMRVRLEWCVGCSCRP